jgi:beta-glucanase (GH16 family)
MIKNKLARWAGLMALSISMAACGHSEVAEPGLQVSDGNWQLVWQDEFEGDALDTNVWNRIADCWGGGNEERQCYTARAENIALDNGRLVITAREEEFAGRAFPETGGPADGDPDARATRSFTSGKLTTQGNASWLYGRFEIRARLPQGQGVWPAFWMLPEPNDYGGWAASGEIDILETVNLGVECEECEEGGENTILGTLHFGGPWPDNAMHSTEVSRPAVLDGEFHTYGVIWERGRFSWTFDGEVFATAEANDWFTTASDQTIAPFDRPFHLIVNLAIGGGLPERRAMGGVSSDDFPKRMEIDWIRIWQCDADPATGRGCIGEN